MIGVDRSCVFHHGCDEGDHAPCGDGNRALVVHACCATVCREFEFPCHEVVIAHGLGAGEQAADIDFRILAHQHAVGVEDEYFAVGVHCAVDGGGFVTNHTIEGDGTGVGLLEVDRFVLVDVETVPVNRCVLGALIDGGGVACLIDIRLPSDNTAACGGRECVGG